MAAATIASVPARAADAGHWVAAWATAQQPVAQHPDTPAFNRAPNLAGQTVRQILAPRIAGDDWRVRVSNRYGRTPLTIDAVSLAPAGRGAALAGAAQAVHFGGARGVTLAAGASRESDPVAVHLDAGPVALSLHLAAGVPTPGDWHKVASQVSYVATDGDHVQDVSGGAFHAGPTSWFFVDALLTHATDDARTAVAIGDSITDGMRSSLNANRRWPDALARRLASDPATARVAVVNLGISGNRLLNDSACYGEKLAERYPHDALDMPGGRYVIALIGINDINFPAMPKRRGLDCDEPHTFVSAADLEAGYRRLIEAAHRAHRLIYGATLTPADLPPDREAIRAAVNQWIRTSGAFDAVIDFDQALRDPRRPQVLIARYDSGDHIHPSDAGYQAMADAIPVKLFTR
ncbi:SGNH/GDSL hydrolase family protein [Robbsia sp. Bb-Pol-6]|uniref:SGNH/GDSL hydrolase family protein n=1 Tax=Robbsia betulipollinis TaxID=2981849 RepID=A0ABT3ZRD5_9BURK|nr:SGNH/GDSL hydrolase family protein [Robbsia betulipollinis]MCY0389101.1 SGNH/GDSL hydrolase family protein [Robbsia betulipollinis]